MRPNHPAGIVAATGNPHKLAEFRRILSPLGIEVLSPADIGISPAVDETGDTFMANARLKARAVFEASGKPALADDSGLCVDALGGRPGVFSARYQGENATYEEKIAALVAELRDIPPRERTARFECAICCMLDADTVIKAQGSVEGFIGDVPRGQNGFGYDPIFYMAEDAAGRTMAQLSDAEKDAVSHRGNALRDFEKKLREMIG